MVKQIKKEELRKMHDREGLVLQGCGGDLKEWVDGINETLEQEGILPKGKRLDDVAVFQNEGSTNLLFFFGEEKLDIGKLAVWRLQTHPQFGGTWMSDYVNNRLGGFLREAVAEKPNCALLGEDGNIFNLMGIAARTLRENGMEEKAEEMMKRITGGECQKKEIETKGLASILKDYRAWIGREGQTSEEAYLRTLEYKNDIYQEIDAHPLGAEEKEEILSEVDLRPDISSCWNREMLPEIVPRLCWKYGVGQGMDMS